MARNPRNPSKWPKCARFPCENANLPHCTYFTPIPPPPLNSGKTKVLVNLVFSWWTFRIFFVFFRSGKGQGESEAPGRGGVGFSIENPRGGRLPTRRGRGPRGREGICGDFLGRGRLNLFFRGWNSHQHACSLHFVCWRFGRFLWSLVGFWRPTISLEHAIEKQKTCLFPH